MSLTLNSVPSVTARVVAPAECAPSTVEVTVCSYAVALEQIETPSELPYVPGNFAAYSPTEPEPSA